MAYEFSKEIEEQQAKVKREIAKLAKMRTAHLISTGQMPAPNAERPAKPGDSEGIKAASLPGQSNIASK